MIWIELEEKLSEDWKELEAYRATGLTPEQIKQMQLNEKVLKETIEIREMTIKRMRNRVHEMLERLL